MAGPETRIAANHYLEPVVIRWIVTAGYHYTGTGTHFMGRVVQNTGWNGARKIFRFQGLDEPNPGAFVDEFIDNGIDIEKISDSDSFLNSLTRNNFDVLIMDIMMPRGESLTANDTKGGIHTGLKLLEE